MCNSEGLRRELWNLNLETASEGKDPKSISALRCTTHGWETHVTTTTTTVSPHFTKVFNFCEAPRQASHSALALDLSRVSFCAGWFANMSQFQQPWSFAITIFSLMNRLQGNCNFQSKSSHKPQPLNPVPRQLGVFATCFIQPGDPREAPGERSLTPTLMINAWNLKMMRIKKSSLRDISV